MRSHANAKADDYATAKNNFGGSRAVAHANSEVDNLFTAKKFIEAGRDVRVARANAQKEDFATVKMIVEEGCVESPATTLSNTKVEDTATANGIDDVGRAIIFRNAKAEKLEHLSQGESPKSMCIECYTMWFKDATAQGSK
jgi:hypothetical protein